MSVLMGMHCDNCQYFGVDADEPSGRGFPCQYRGKESERPCEFMMLLEDELTKEENREWQKSRKERKDHEILCS